MSFLLFDPMLRPLGDNGEILPGCYLQWYESETTTPTPVYADAALESELTNPVVADASGRLPAMYGHSAVVYRRQLYDADDVLLLDTDPIHPTAQHPAGTLMMFDGTEEERDAAYPPALWEVCDGDNGTKDTRDHSPIGVSNTKPISGDGSTGGSSGGTVQTSAAGAHDHGGAVSAVSLSEAQGAAHRHALFINATGSGSLTSSNQTYFASNSGGDTEYSLDGAATEATIGRSAPSGGGGTHAHSITAAADHQHDVELGDVQSPYFTVWFLLRKA